MDTSFRPISEILASIIDHRGLTATKIGGKWENNEGIPVISANNIKNGIFVEMDSVKRINKDLFEKWMPVKLRQGDVLLVSEGATFGELLYLTENLKAALGQRLFALRCNSEYDGKYLYYYLRSEKGQQELNARTTGTSVLGIRQSELILILVPIIKIEEQEVIGNILGAIDDKIRLNQEMTKTLEAIGEAVFKRWFVDFEFPNQEGKPYKSSGGKMIESEAGLIPEGWRIGRLDDICEVVMGQSPPGESYNESVDGVPFFQGVRDFCFRFPSKRVYCTAPSRFAEKGDVLLSVRAPVGSLNVSQERCAIGRGVAAIRLKEKQGSFLYYLLLSTASGWDEFEAKGTVFGSATKEDVCGFKTLLPPENLRDKFGELMESFDKRILVNDEQSRTLTIIRDSLLPRLMTGKIRVPITKEKMETSCHA